MPVRASLDSAFAELKEMMSGAALRTIAGIKDMGEVLVATIGDPGGDAHDVGTTDLWTRFTDVLSGLSDVGRLYIPAGILFRFTPAGMTAHVIRGRKMRAPGASLVIPDGGDGNATVVPGWDDSTNLDKNNAGIQLPEGFHIESTGDRVRIVANSGGTKCLIELQKGGSILITPAAGQTIQLGGTSHKAILDTLLSDLATALGYIPTAASTTYPGLVPNVTQWAAFLASLSNGTYLSQIVKNG